ncbi:MAG: hypothetical protein AAF404_15920 [Pseudomonadota bacterium]
MASLIALLISITGGALAQLSMKAGVQSMDSVLPNTLLIFGIGCYAVAMLSWIYALKKYDLGFAYPLLSIGYLLVYIGAFFWPGLEEELSWNKTIGLSLVILGVTISAQKNNNGERIRHEKHRAA